VLELRYAALDERLQFLRRGGVEREVVRHAAREAGRRAAGAALIDEYQVALPAHRLERVA
jgi:hypothetical protein